MTTANDLKLTNTSIKIKHDGTTDSTSATTGAVQVAGGVGIGKNLFVGEDINISGLVKDANAQLHLQDASFDTYLKNTNSGGTLYLEGYDIQLRDSANTAQKVTVDGGDLTSTGALISSSTTDNTLGSTDGALRITGGASIAKNLTIGTGARIKSTNTLSFNQASEKVWSSTAGQLDLGANTKIYANNPLQLASTLTVGGTSTFSDSITVANTKDILAATAGGSDLGSATAEWGDIYLADDKGIKFGSDQDATVSHDGSVLTLQGANIQLKNAAGDKTTFMSDNQTAKLFYDNSVVLTTNSSGATIDGNLAVTDVVASGDILPSAATGSNLGSTSKEWDALYMGDNKPVYFGAGQNTYIMSDASNMDVRLQGSTVLNIENASGEKLLGATQDAGFLSYQNSQKLIASNTGVSVTGTAAISGDIVVTGTITASNVVNSGGTLNADTATKLANARTIQLTGDATGSTSFDGSGNVSIATTIQGSGHNHEIGHINGLSTITNNAFRIDTSRSNNVKSDIILNNTTTYSTPIGTDTDFSTSVKTKQNKISLSSMTQAEGQNTGGGRTLENSNDSGMIAHETSNVSDNSESNRSVIHLCPGDDVSSFDYVAIHGKDETIGSGVKIDTAGNITAAGTLTTNSFSVSSSSSNPFNLGDAAVGNYLDLQGNTSQNRSHIHNVKQVEISDFYTGAGGSDDSAHIRRVDGGVQICGAAAGSSQGGLRAGFFTNSEATNLADGEILSKKDIMSGKQVRNYAGADHNSNPGAPSPVTIFAKTGWSGGTVSYLTSGVSGTPVLLGVDPVRFPCRGIYRITTTVYMDEGTNSENMRFNARLWVSKSSSTSNVESPNSTNEQVGTHWFNEGEHGSWTQDQIQTNANVTVIDPTQTAKFSGVSSGAGSAYVFWDLDDEQGVANVYLISYMIELITPLASGSTYTYEG